jgi:2,3-bisphosphoglycerate-dependent phosphoglycerate mutase
MEVFLIRHGQSFNNTLPDGAGRVADPPLTETGEKQAERVATHLRDAAAKMIFGVSDGVPDEGYGITRLCCSAMLRCLQTSEPIGKALGLRPEIWTDVHEEGGIWLEGEPDLPGMTRSEISSRFPDVVLSDEVSEDGWWLRPQETQAQWRTRAKLVGEQLMGEMAESDERIAVVTHGGFTSDLLSELLNGGPLTDGGFSTRNTSIAHIRFEPGQFHLTCLNRLEHLPADLVT